MNAIPKTVFLAATPLPRGPQPLRNLKNRPIAPISELLSPGLWVLGGPLAVAIFQIVEISRTAEPGATDNPDDAQRLREDH
jgi:hypothetical protein